MKPHLIMPMGGAGARFYKEGYAERKPLIEINGKPFLYWATMSIVKFVDVADLTFIVLQEHIDDFEIDKVIGKYFPEARIEVLPEILPGPVFTSLKGIATIEDNAPVVINDCDHMFKCKEVNDILNSGKFDMDGGLLTFHSDSPQFSYIKYGDNGEVAGTIEKKVVSNHAICGAYMFRMASMFQNVAESYIQNCPYNECFMSGIYNIMCERGMKVRDFFLDFHVEFGTPEEYEAAVDSPYFREL